MYHVTQLIMKKEGCLRRPALRLTLERGRGNGVGGCTWQIAEFLIPILCSRMTLAPVIEQGPTRRYKQIKIPCKNMKAVSV